MERVFICSPFRGAEEKNVELARKYARFAYEKGCLPVVPHLYFPQFLKESDVQERMAGIQFGLSLLKESPIHDLVFPPARNCFVNILFRNIVLSISLCFVRRQCAQAVLRLDFLYGCVFRAIICYNSFKHINR